MPVDVIMPNLGLTMDAGTVARWLVAAGERVEKGQPLFEVETDKVGVEVEAPAAGVLGPALVETGRKVAVGTVLARIHESGEGDVETLTAVGATKDEGAKADREPLLAPLPGPSPVWRPLSPALPPPRSGLRVFSSPRARRLAREHGIDWRSLAGSGPHGRVVERDVLRADAAQKELPLPGGAKQPPQSFLTAEVDLSALLAIHRRLTPFLPGLRLSDWLARIAGMALDETKVEAELVIGSVNRSQELIGSAREHAHSLSDAARRSLVQIMAERRSPNPPPAPTPSPVFLLFDFSAGRISTLAPLLTEAEVACLALGQINKAEQAMIALTFDSSAITGTQAMQLVEKVIDLIEEPLGLLLAG